MMTTHITDKQPLRFVAITGGGTDDDLAACALGATPNRTSSTASTSICFTRAKKCGPIPSGTVSIFSADRPPHSPDSIFHNSHAATRSPSAEYHESIHVLTSSPP